MTTGIPDSLERLTQADLIGVVRELIGEVGRLRAENEKLSGALTKLKTEHQAIKDELARLKNLPPRPPQKPSGMDKATDQGGSGSGKSGYTTQIGSDSFTVFRTGPSKSRLAFLSRLCGSTAFYVINDAALDYMKDRQLPQAAIDKFAAHKERIFSCPEAWERHLQALGLTALKVTPDPVLIASEGALWGAIRHQGLLQNTVIVSDDAGQFRVGVHALCWVHAERLVHKLVPTNDKQRNAIEVAKRMIWWFYGSLKEYKLAPSPQRPARPLRPHLQARRNRLRDARPTAQTTVSSQGCFAACPRSAGNPPQHQRLRK